MCGIAGIYSSRETNINIGLIKSMTDSIAHRGPDGEGHFIKNRVALGHRRLAILDLSDAGRQPMSSEDGKITITYNGEIYNFKELREELQKAGYQFQSGTDTEVIIKGYQHWGLDVIPKLNGMFAFALWDENKEELLITRDRYGVKPIYLWVRSDEVVFASEIKAILQHPEYKIDINYEALSEYFTFQNIFRFHTLFKDIHSPAYCGRNVKHVQEQAFEYP